MRCDDERNGQAVKDRRGGVLSEGRGPERYGEAVEDWRGDD